MSRLREAGLRWAFRVPGPPLFALLRRVAPVLRVRGVVVVARHGDVLDVLARDADFGQTYLPRMEALGAPFLLGMADSDAYRRHRAALHDAAPREDLAGIAQRSREAAERMLATAGGRIDVVAGLADPILYETVGDYLGRPGPDPAESVGWAKAIFHEVFLNRGDAAVTRRAVEAASRMGANYDRLIAERRARPAGRADMLGRLVAMAEGDRPRLTDAEVRDDLMGLVAAWVTSVSRSLALALDELLRRPDALAAAARAARDEDAELVGAHLWEALRFAPQAPLLPRRSTGATTLGPRGTAIPAGATVLALVASAMRDGRAVREPRRFRVDRPASDHLHFGHELHRCFGEPISRVQMAAIATALLRAGDLRRQPGRRGRLRFEGPFPAGLGVAFGPR